MIMRAAVCSTSDGGFAVAGFINLVNDPFSADGILVRLNSDGDTLWTRFFPGSPVTMFNGIQATYDRGFILAGFQISPEDSAGSAILIKTDSTGQEEWTRTYGRSLDDNFADLLILPDSGFVCTGYSLSEDQLRPEVLLVRTTLTGDTFGPGLML